MRSRARTYRTLDGASAERDVVAWYWRLVAAGASIMILGGFLMLPSTFDGDAQLRVSKAALGIFAVALLTAGFSFTALLCFAVRNVVFQAEAVFLPALSACALGLLTIFYDFLISARFVWNTPALLLTIAASITTIIYGALLILTHRRVHGGLGTSKPYRAERSSMQMPLNRGNSINSGVSTGVGSVHYGVTDVPTDGLWQDPGYYENYNRNMYPTSSHQPAPPGYDVNAITEEEMQRQQMLMLLLHREQPPTPDPSASTFHIDWQGHEGDDMGMMSPPPLNGYYAPGATSQTPASAFPQSAVAGAFTPQTATGIVRQMTGELPLPPWDRVWRGPLPEQGRGRATSNNSYPREVSRERREERRREIEMGR